MTPYFTDFDHQAGRLLEANCGRLPGLVLRADGQLQRVEATCTVVGLFRDLPCAIDETDITLILAKCS